MESFTRNDRIEQLQRQLMEQQTENERLRHESSVMVQNYLRQLETKEDVIQTLKNRLDNNPPGDLVNRQEYEAIRQENRILRDKISDLNRDLDLAHQDHQAPSVMDAVESENKRLRADLVDKEREYAR